MKNQTQLNVVDEVFPFLLLTGTVVFYLIALEDNGKFWWPPCPVACLRKRQKAGDQVN